MNISEKLIKAKAKLPLYKVSKGNAYGLGIDSTLRPGGTMNEETKKMSLADIRAANMAKMKAHMERNATGSEDHHKLSDASQREVRDALIRARRASTPMGGDLETVERSATEKHVTVHHRTPEEKAKEHKAALERMNPQGVKPLTGHVNEDLRIGDKDGDEETMKGAKKVGKSKEKDKKKKAKAKHKKGKKSVKDRVKDKCYCGTKRGTTATGEKADGINLKPSLPDGK